MEATQTPQAISRRRALRTIGAGTAAVWSAPVVTSVGARALAANGSPAMVCGGQPCAPLDCQNIVPCPGQSCFCTTLLDGSCLCAGPESQGFDCASDADCVDEFGEGFRCGNTVNCGDPNNRGCFKACA
jgi:hypothetical protein